MNIKELQKKQNKEFENIVFYRDVLDVTDDCDRDVNVVIKEKNLKNFIAKVRRETAEKILRKIKKRRNEALNLKGYHPANAETARRHIDGLDVAIKLLDQILKELKGGE